VTEKSSQHKNDYEEERNRFGGQAQNTDFQKKSAPSRAVLPKSNGGTAASSTKKNFRKEKSPLRGKEKEGPD